MRNDEYITHLRSKNIIVTVHDEELAVHDPDEALTKEIIQELKVQKENIIAFFNSIKNKTTLTPIVEAPRLDMYPLSSVQRRMYFLYEFDKQSTSYNIPMGFQVNGKLDIEKLELSILKLIERHECLRTIYLLEEDTLYQKVIDVDDFTINYKKGNLETVNEEFTAFIRPFNLNKEYPIRVCLLTISNEVYFLFIDIHHITGDLHSIELLTKDLLSFYNGLELPKLELQYKDYAYWEQEKEQQESYSIKKEFWITEFNTQVEKLNLPIDYEYPIIRTNKGNSIDFIIEERYVKKIQNIVESVDGTFFMGLFSIFSIFLSKISYTDDIVIGTPVVVRGHSSLEQIVGMFVNTLAIRSQVNSEEVFHKYLINVKNKITQCIDNQTYQYEELIDALKLSRDTSRNPLFDVMLVYTENEHKLNKYQFNDVVFKKYALEETTTKFDLLLKSVIINGQLHCGFQYNTDLFSEVTIRRLIKYFTHLLKQIASTPKAKINDLQLLELSDKNVLLESFNSTAKPYNLDKTVLDLFKTQVALSPSAIALQFNDKCMSYEELDACSDRWSAYLILEGAKKESIVGMLMNRSFEMIIGILAIMKSGGAYLPIDPDQPEARTVHMLAESQSNILLSNVEKISLTISQVCKVLTIHELDNHTERATSTQYPTGEDLAYIIYTSGSTGLPKGVMVKHKSVSNLIYHERDFLEINQEEKILQFSPYYFDVSVQQIWLSLTTGATLLLVTKEVLGRKDILVNYIYQQGITLLNVTPSYLESLDLPDIPSLKKIVVSGEECSSSLARKYNTRYDFYNEYGPTEATVIAISDKVTSSKSTKSKLSIGLPIGNMKAYILSVNLGLVPIGSMGELYLCGVGVSDGYLNNPELTAERFISNPYGLGMLYKTGDLASWNTDGTIKYLGRVDQQIKYKGVRIEAGEIENHICLVHGIKECIVTVKNVNDKEVLIAYYVSENEQCSEDIQIFLSERLPLTMIPRYYMQLIVMPVTVNGKLDRKKLPEVINIEKPYVMATNATEEQLVAIWATLLNIEASTISIHDSFFNIGGNSLIAITLANSIGKNMDIEISLKEIFIKQTIRKIAVYIIAAKQIKGTETTDNKIKLII